jgi:FixJ family two-component response regulator
MPGMDGLEVQKLVSNRASIPVIFITGRGDVPSTVRAMKDGAVDFLTKPIDETVLLAPSNTPLRKTELQDAKRLNSRTSLRATIR